MKYAEVTWSELGWESEPERSDDGKAQRELDRKVDCQDILRQLKWPILFGKLKKDEKILSRLFYVEKKSKSEIARLLGKDEEDVDYQIEKLRAKIRYRAQRTVEGTPVEDALIKLGILPAKKIAARKSRAASKPRTPSKRATAKKRTALSASKRLPV